MKTIAIIATLALSSCAFRLNADGSKDVSVDAPGVAVAVLKVISEK